MKGNPIGRKKFPGECRYEGCFRSPVTIKHRLCQSHYHMLLKGEELRPIHARKADRPSLTIEDVLKVIERLRKKAKR